MDCQSWEVALVISLVFCISFCVCFTRWLEYKKGN
jgi:hypothetical protein